MPPERLLREANQIGRAFAHRGADAPAAVAAHLRAFWDPRMRRAILAHLEAGGAGLDAPVQAALALLAAEQAKRSH
jgi:formate dehydrogenase subunit delta